MLDLNACAAIYTTNQTLIDKYGYTGPTRGISRNKTTQITWRGCEELCGTGIQYYAWTDIASTMTTWVLPIVGVLLQAPFESNQFWATVFAMNRWIGNPITSLSYILWNIKVTGRCALLIDMARPYDEKIPGPDTDFASMRDSLYILTTMNQFSMKPAITNRRRRQSRSSGSLQAFATHLTDQRHGSGQSSGDVFEESGESLKNEGEGLLRIVLFSKDLILKNSPGKDSLHKRREMIARNMRENRKRGVVPVFISIMWFLFCMAISIEAAFGDFGIDAEAHDLGLGLLLAWLPVLILSSIVDRNSVSTDRVRQKLNKLIEEVCESLKDREIRDQYCEAFKDHPDAADFRRRVNAIVEKIPIFEKEYFEDFAGQGRVRWHYGAAQPILTSIERHYIAEKGRGWLVDEQDARTNLVLGKRGDDGLIYFDYRELFQVLMSAAIVTLPVYGAFILSYWTPTVGLGCRSGGYLVFWIIAIFLTISEMTIFILITPFGWLDPLRRYTRRRLSASKRRLSVYAPVGHESSALRIKRTLLFLLLLIPRTFNVADRLFTKMGLLMVRFSDRTDEMQRERVEQLEQARQDRKRMRESWTLRVWLDICVFKPLEMFNTAWLSYIVMAQTIGFYQTCACQSSLWGPGGGYLDFRYFYASNEHYLKITWSLGTSIACAVMCVAMVYIVIEWCVQSHLSTEDYDNAAAGLRRTRQFRSMARPFREFFSSSTIRKVAWYTWHSFVTAKNVPESFHNKHTLTWSKEMKNAEVRNEVLRQRRRSSVNTYSGDKPLYPVKDRRGVGYLFGKEPLAYAVSTATLDASRQRSRSEVGRVTPAGEAPPDWTRLPQLKITPSRSSGFDDNILPYPSPAAHSAKSRRHRSHRSYSATSDFSQASPHSSSANSTPLRSHSATGLLADGQFQSQTPTPTPTTTRPLPTIIQAPTTMGSNWEYPRSDRPSSSCGSDDISPGDSPLQSRPESPRQLVDALAPPQQASHGLTDGGWRRSRSLSEGRQQSLRSSSFQAAPSVSAGVLAGVSGVSAALGGNGDRDRDRDRDREQGGTGGASSDWRPTLP